MLRTFPILLALGLLFWGLGCSKNPTDIETGSNAIDLNDSFGGFTASDEKPAFDDPDLLAQLDNDEMYDDPILSLAEIGSLLTDDESGFYHLRIVWGRLCLDTTVTEATDWSGSLSINRGAEIIRRVIRFEPNQDYVLPRTDRRLIEWVSTTSVHNDGMAFDIVIPRPKALVDTTAIIDTTSENDTIATIVVDTVYPLLDPVAVVFETGPYRSTFTLDEIRALDTIIYLDDSNAVLLHGLKLDDRTCPRGFLAGVWGEDAIGRGVFKGLWTSRSGYVTGFVKGHYGQNELGLNVFKGKWITRSGKFEGFLTGVWSDFIDDTADNLSGAGFFRGTIYTVQGLPAGVMKGRFSSSQLVNDGSFQGRWRVFCSDPDDLSDNTEENF